jgi:hypothetical protein
MASFTGTEEDFNTYIGPRIKNLVNQIVRKDRGARNGICQRCCKKSELDSAYVHGKDSRTLIKMALKDFDKSSYIEVDLIKFEELLIEYHQPVAETFLFLCQECHREYDVESEFTATNNNTEDKEIQKVLNRIDRWFRNRNQINSKILYAFINLYKKFDGNVDVHNLAIESRVDTFYSNFTQMKNFGERNHGKIFEQYGSHVYLWEPIEKIVWEKYCKYNSESNR